MYFTQASTLLAVFGALANAAAIEKRAAALDVVLKAGSGPAEVIATVTNSGKQDLNLLTLGTFLDFAPVEKLFVSDESDSAVPFTGIFRSVQRSGLDSKYFFALPAGASHTVTINSAAVHELSTGVYSFVAAGAIPFAVGKSTQLSGSAVVYESNVLSIPVDGAAAAAVPRAIMPISLAERTVLQAGGTTAQRTATTNGLRNCVTLANAAAAAAASGSASKFSEYFKTTATATRNTVAARLRAVAAQANTLNSGVTRYYSTDPYGYCGSNVLAYTIPSTNEIANCPLFYSVLPALTRNCHAQDQATTTLHELTHAPGTYRPGTVDNGYGYAASTALTTARAVLNADSYALYANALYAGC